MDEVSAQFADPGVSRVKFDREIAEFQENASTFRRRGWLLVVAEFPKVLVVMAAPQLSPPAIILGVALDYSNYDAAPPSVRLVEPFTDEPYQPDQLPTVLKRSVDSAGPGAAGLPPGFEFPAGAQLRVEQPLMQWHEGGLPFLCVAGVREYHDHPAHSGDSWELHRASGAGRLIRLLEVIDTYGVRPITEYGVQLVPKISGFHQGAAPA